MKIVNDSIKNALKQPTTQRKGRILVDGNYYDVFNVEYYADAYNEGNVIGNAIASQLDFDLPYIPKFETFKYFDGVWTGTNYEYIDMGTFHVFDEQDEDDFNKHITAFDNLIKFNTPFQDVGGYPKKLFHELQNICNQAGVNLTNTNIPNGNFEVVNNQFTNGENLKTVLKAICQLAGMYAIIKNDEVVLQLKNQTNEVINKEQHEPTIWKRRSYGINQVILGLSDVEGEYVIREDKNDIAQNGVHKLVINDNPFAYTETKRDELIDELFNQVRGFGYIPYEVKGEWLNYLEIGDTITIDDVETITLRINGKSPKALESMMSAPAIIDSSVEYVNNTNTVKNQLIRTEISVDKQNQQIEAVVSQTDEQNQKIAKVTQTVDELNSKISDIADITISGEDTDAQVELENINQSEPIRLVIRPIGESISYDYPHEDYPQEDFSKIRTIRFTNTKTEEVFDYILPMDLLYYDSEHYDEFILDYEGQTCMVNKRVGYNADGTTYVLDSEQIIECKEYPKILLTEGDYKVQVLGYDTAYIFVRLMAQNIYTTQFYTKAETDSIISQTSQSIDLSVNKKLSNYSTTAEMNSAIQLNASSIKNEVNATIDGIEKDINAQLELKVNTDDLISEINASADVISLKGNRFIVEADNFRLDKNGNMESTSGKIGGFSIGETELYSHHVGTYTYTTNDTTKIRNYILGTYQLTNAEKILYDVDGDGQVTAVDYAKIINAINSGNPTMSGTVELSSQSMYSMLRIKDNNGQVVTDIGINGLRTNGTVNARVMNCDGNISTSGLNSDDGDISVGINESGNPLIRLSSTSGTVHCVSVNPTSLEENKKNIEKFENALPILKNIDIHKYNYKLEEDKHKKHLGFVIGEDYNYSSEITSVDENGNENGVDLYSMTSLCLQAIKELSSKVETLENKIKELESE